MDGPRLGRYLLRRRLAVGGMGEIYLAEVESAGDVRREVVLKRIRPDYAADPAFSRMFLDEARTASALRHANVVQVLDFEEHDGGYLLALEYVEGRNLLELITRAADRAGAPMPAHLAAYLFREAAQGLGYAHRKTGPDGAPLGIIHRDVSPPNLLVSYEGEVKLTDFGVARSRSNVSHTAVGFVKGKIAYMAPEQARGLAIDHRSDLFSLGATIYYAVTGRHPFATETEVGTIERLLQATHDRAAALAPGVPAELDDILEATLEVEPANRIGGAAELVERLEAFLHDVREPWGARALAEYVTSLFPDRRPPGEPVAAAAAGRPPVAARPGREVAAGPEAAVPTRLRPEAGLGPGAASSAEVDVPTDTVQQAPTEPSVQVAIPGMSRAALDAASRLPPSATSDDARPGAARGLDGAAPVSAAEALLDGPTEPGARLPLAAPGGDRAGGRAGERSGGRPGRRRAPEPSPPDDRARTLRDLPATEAPASTRASPARPGSSPGDARRANDLATGTPGASAPQPGTAPDAAAHDTDPAAGVARPTAAPVGGTGAGPSRAGGAAGAGLRLAALIGLAAAVAVATIVALYVIDRARRGELELGAGSAADAEPAPSSAPRPRPRTR